MTTILTTLTDATKLDGLDVAQTDTVVSFTWLYTVLIEEAVTFPTEAPVLKASDYPVLAAIWDNEDDAAYDNL